MFRKTKRLIRRISVGFRLAKQFQYSFDVVDTIFDSCFFLFNEFYENGNIDMVNWNSDPSHIFAKKEMDHLYFWFNVLRNKQLQKMEMLCKRSIKNHRTSSYRKEIDVANNIYNKQQEMLERLIKIREYMWT